MRHLIRKDELQNPMSHENRAIVLGLSPTGLSTVRSLGRRSVPVFGMDYDRNQHGFHSKYSQSFLCPHPVFESEKLIDFLFKTGMRLNEKAVLFPTSDEFVMFVSANRKDLDKYFLYALPDHDIVVKLLNKHTTSIVAEEYHIPHPTTYFPADREQLEKILPEIKYPAFIKPCLTYEWKQKGFSVKGFIVNSSKELFKSVSQMFENEISVIIQSYVEGPPENLFEVCCYVSGRNGVRGGFIKRKIRQYPNNCGLGSYVESIRNEDLLEISKQYLNNIKFVGPAEIEYKRDLGDNKFKMLEINPRITLQNGLAEFCGINFPLMQYYDLVGVSYHGNENYEENIRWMWVEIDIQSYNELRKSEKITMYRWLETVLKTNTYAIFAWDDPMPFIVNANFGLKILRYPYGKCKKYFRKD